MVAPYLHLALGYPGLCLTPEAQAYRRTYCEGQRVVQAYEQHEHVYRQLRQRGGIVLLRGKGIVASRILQRLDDIRSGEAGVGQHIQVIHLLRSPSPGDTVYGRARRRTHHHWQLQPFNWPKAAFGGDLRATLEAAGPEERRQLLATWGGTTTSDRRDWQAVVERGQREGWYSLHFGTIEQLKPNQRHRLVIQTQDYAPPHSRRRWVVDFIFDCTGLNHDVEKHPLLADLIPRYGLRQNETGRLAVPPDFEIEGLRNGGGRVFSAGMMVAGNAFAPVDSFLGLQYAAQRSVDVLIGESAPGLRHLNGLASLRQWWRWLNGSDPSSKL
jgi:hypothetical protein